MNHFTHRQISQHCDLIYEQFPGDPGGHAIGLVVGNEKAAVIDTGWGVTGNLREYVRSITDLPAICILTHPHPDHAGAAPQFEEVYMNPDDASLLDWALKTEKRLADAGRRHEQDPELLEEMRREATDCSSLSYHDLTDGQCLDLGGISVEAVAVPGHTAGSTAVFCRMDNVLFAGDAIAPRMLLLGEGPEPSVPVAVYLKALEHLLTLTDEDTQIINGHTDEILHRDLIEDLLTICRGILSQSIQTQPAEHLPPNFGRNQPEGAILEAKCGSASLTYNRFAVDADKKMEP